MGARVVTLQAEIREEDARLARARSIVDAACFRLRRQVTQPHEAIDLIVETKGKVLELFPDKSAQFDLIYLPRMLRLVKSRWGGGAVGRGHAKRILLPEGRKS